MSMPGNSGGAARIQVQARRPCGAIGAQERDECRLRRGAGKASGRQFAPTVRLKLLEPPVARPHREVECKLRAVQRHLPPLGNRGDAEEEEGADDARDLGDSARDVGGAKVLEDVRRHARFEEGVGKGERREARALEAGRGATMRRAAPAAA